ncbi:Erf family protein [Enterococcus casseliflavus 14-MB-W-14]|uniref:ERF family protein n=1 Tax=Enterococcus casseliflavus TaxID=37734 RepID=UPI0003543F98|nr:ERF family protein [Enterococcus casseliflavus]EPH59992.1 Erf family protein [Enterococcus casseliflavus 14-MB-W-14]
MSELELTFNQKLIKIQAELKVPKSNYSDFGGYNFRNAEDILKAVKPHNLNHGLLLTLTDMPIFMDGRFYIKATATLTDGTDSLKVEAYAREADSKPKMDDSQVTGSASSYARKYALQGLYLVDDGIDPDSLNEGEEEPEKSEQEVFFDYFKFYANGVAELTKKPYEEIEANVLGVNTFARLEDVTPDMYAQVIGTVKAMGKRAELQLKENEAAAKVTEKPASGSQTTNFTWGK